MSQAGEQPRGALLLDALERGDLRVAQQDAQGAWQVQAWIKEEILNLFRGSPVVPFGDASSRALWPFLDKAPFAVRGVDGIPGARLVPGGSAVRRGAHIGNNVVLMPPCYVNVGAYVGEGSMIDSHALVGSCAQVGARVHVSAAAQLGGVLEPVGARPVIVEDDCLIGAHCGVFEGVLVRAGAVLAAGVILTASTPVFDLVHERELSAPFEIPPRAVVVPGARPARSAWARERGLTQSAALIVKYRDESTERASALEEALR